MKKINKLLLLGLTLFMGVSLASCGSSSSSSGGSGSEGDGGSGQKEEIVMTQSYSDARNQFKTLTGLELPEIANIEVGNINIQTSGLSTIKIDSGSALNYQTYFKFESFFQKKIGSYLDGFPTGDMANGRIAEWQSTANRWYQTKWEVSKKAITISTEIRIPEIKEMTASYKKAREQYKEYAGFELQEIYNVEAKQSNIDAYDKNADSYEVELLQNERINEELFSSIMASFIVKFDQPNGEYPDTTQEIWKAVWLTENMTYSVKFFHNQNSLIIGASIVRHMTDSYQQGRDKFYNITNVSLPELVEIELLDSSSFDFDAPYAHFRIEGTASIYEQFETKIKSELSNREIAHEEEYLLRYEWEDWYNYRNNLVTFELSFDSSSKVLSVDFTLEAYYSLTVNITPNEHGSSKVDVFVENQLKNGTFVEKLFVDDQIKVVATIDEEYRFIGWYYGEEKLSESLEFSFKMTADDLTIECRLEKRNITSSYRNSRELFFDFTGFLLPILENVETSDGKYSNSISIEGINNATYAQFETLRDFFDAKLVSWGRNDSDNSERTMVRYNAGNGSEIAISWWKNDERFYLTADGFSSYTFCLYEDARTMFKFFYNIELPAFEGVNVTLGENDFAKDKMYVHMMLFNDEGAFVLENGKKAFMDIVAAFNEALGDPINFDENGSVDWQPGPNYHLYWDQYYTGSFEIEVYPN